MTDLLTPVEPAEANTFVAPEILTGTVCTGAAWVDAEIAKSNAAPAAAARIRAIASVLLLLLLCIMRERLDCHIYALTKAKWRGHVALACRRIMATTIIFTATESYYECVGAHLLILAPNKFFHVRYADST